MGSRLTSRLRSQALCQHVELCNCNKHAGMRLSSWNKNKYDFLEGWLLKIQGLVSRARQSTAVAVIYSVLLVVA